MTSTRRGLRRLRTHPPAPTVVDGWEDDALPGDPAPDSAAGRILRALRTRPEVYGRVATRVNPFVWSFSEDAIALDWLKRRGLVEWESRSVGGISLRVDVWARVLADPGQASSRGRASS